MNNEAVIRLSVFSAIFLIVGLFEILRPRRPLGRKKLRRWGQNLGLIGFNTLLVRLIPLTTVFLAEYAAAKEWGLFHSVSIPMVAQVILTVLLFDVVIYFQHVIFHRVPILWRLHKVHHADTDFDVTTALRFHPIEIILSYLVKYVAIVLLGPPALGVVLFEIILNGSAMFNHGNFYIPKSLDKLLRLAVVTPDMHRIHHSWIAKETNSNYGFFISAWDRIFKTYIEAPKDPQETMTLGIPEFRKEEDQTLTALLTIPFQNEKK